MLLDLLSNPAIAALIAAIPSILLALYGYRQSIRLDKRAEASGAASFQLGAIGKVIDGQNALIDSLQKDNQMLREHAAQLVERIAGEKAGHSPSR